MVETSSPALWRRWLANELRQLRRDRGLAQKQVGQACGWSGARLSYIENGLQAATTDDLDRLLPLYEVPEEQRTPYYEAAERSRTKAWWDQDRYQREMPTYLRRFVDLEQGAAAIQVFEPVVLPGLLQTSTYAGAVLRRDIRPRTDQELAALSDLRLARQAIIGRSQDPVEFDVVLDEAVLRHVARDTSTMAEQLNHVLAMAERPNITIRVLPFAQGAQSYAQGEFMIFVLPWGREQSAELTVYVEHRDQAIYLEDPLEVRGYVLAFHNLWESSLPETESVAMIREISKEYTET